ncbi:hypothetical protein ABBQ32_006497 [Trebouxia sp. C0010 RCD-2024]
MQTVLTSSRAVTVCQQRRYSACRQNLSPRLSLSSLTSARPVVHQLKNSTRRRPKVSGSSFQVCAGRLTSAEPWWEKNNPPNMKSITSVQDLVDAMADAGDKLVIVDFYAQWCAACRALFPKLCQICTENEDIVVLKVDWDQNKPIARPLGVKVLPFFMFYRGADGLLTSFSASVSKVQRLRDAIVEHNTDRCYVSKNPGMEQFPDVKPHAEAKDLSDPPDVTHLDDVEQQEPAAV